MKKSKWKSKTIWMGAITILGSVITGLESGADTKTIIIGALGAVMIVLRKMTKEAI
jgi:hypothetical protein